MNRFLRNEKKELEKKITEAREKGKENTYKNLIQAYERIISLIYQDEDRNGEEYKDLYFEAFRGENGSSCIMFFIDDKIISINKIDCEFIENILNMQIFEKYNIRNIYGNTFGIGMFVGDLLNKMGYEIKPTTVRNFNNCNITNSNFGKEIKQNFKNNIAKTK